MKYARAHEDLIRILAKPPILSPEVRNDVVELVGAGEAELALDTLCSWLYEDAHVLDIEYVAELKSIAHDLGAESALGRVRELVPAEHERWLTRREEIGGSRRRG